MSNITIDEIRHYVEYKGPKRQYVDPVIYFLLKTGERLSPSILKKERAPRFIDSISARIQEILPKEGQIILSGKNRKVIIYDTETQSYREAAFDPSTLQVIPTEQVFELNGHRPTSPLDIVSFRVTPGRDFYGNPGGQANFLDKVLEYKAPVLELGRIIQRHSLGLGMIGHVPIKQYSS